jgi:hypothetical protein
MNRSVQRRFAGVFLATAMLAATAFLPVAAGHAAPAGHPAPATVAKKKPVTFGAKLTAHSQPSNAFDGQPCEPKTVACTRVMTEAYRRPDPETDQVAPKDGTIGKIMIVAGVAGKFRLDLAHAKVGKQKAKLVAVGPVIHYLGQGTGDQDNGPPYTVETFKVNLKVKKGDFLAVQAKKISFEYCSGGGDSQLTFEPPLALETGYHHTNHVDGCLMLLEAVYKK